MQAASDDEVSWPQDRGRHLSGAKLSASLKWLLHKAYDGNVPVEFREPLPAHKNDTIATAHINAGVRALLVNSKLYCAACERLFASWKTAFNGHWSVIQSLARHGFSVTFDDDDVVTEADLLAVQPFNVRAHVAVIDTIMAAFLVEVAPVARVMAVIRAVTSVSASKELPLSPEEALLLWVSKMWSLSEELRHQARRLQLLRSSPATMHISRNQLAPQEPDLPLDFRVENVVEVLQDGRCLAVVISWCFPEDLKMEDLCLVPSGNPEQDAQHNWQYVGTFCSLYNLAGLHFVAEDLRGRASHVMKPNVLALVCELWVAFSKSISATIATARDMPPGGAVKTAAAAKSATAAVISNGSQNLISDVTKRSFSTGRHVSNCTPSAATAPAVAAADEQQLPAGSSTSRSDISGTGVFSLPKKQPLLDKRQRDLEQVKGITRSSSLSSLATAPGELKSSVCAWEDKNGITHGPDTGPAPCFKDGVGETVTSSVTCSSRWGVYPCEPDQSGAVSALSTTAVQSFVALPDSARTVTLSSRSPPPAELNTALPTAMSGNLRHASPRQLVVSPVATASTCESADQECLQILSARQDQQCRAVANSPLDTETPVTVRSLVSNATLWGDDENDVSVSPYPDSVSGGGFFLRRSDNAVTGLTNGSCSSSVNGALLVRGIQTNRNDNETVADGADISGDGETSESGGMSRTTSFAELKQLNSAGSSQKPSVAHEDLAVANYRSLISSPLTGGMSLKTEFIKAKSSQAGSKGSKKTTFALKQTTWVESAKHKGTTGPSNGEMEVSMTGSSSSSSGSGSLMTSSDMSTESSVARQHADVKLMLAEKRRAIEASRRTASAARSEERDEISREAFVQAVLKQRLVTSGDGGSEQPSALSVLDGSSVEERMQLIEEAAAADGNLPELAMRDLPSACQQPGAAGAADVALTISAAAGRAVDEEQEQLDWPDASYAAAASTAAEDPAVENYSASLDKLSSSISELQFELARLALKQKHMEDASAAAIIAAAAAASVGTVNSRHPMFPLPSQAAAAEAALAAAAAAGLPSGASFAAAARVLPASGAPVPVPRASGLATSSQPLAAVAGYLPPAAMLGQPHLATPVVVDGSSPSSPAPKATSRHGTVPLTAAASASAGTERRSGTAGFARSSSLPPTEGTTAHADVRTSAVVGAGVPKAAALAAGRTKAGSNDSGAFFVPVEMADRNVERRNSSDAGYGHMLAEEKTSRSQASGKRATWCTSSPGTALAATEPRAAMAADAREGSLLVHPGDVDDRAATAGADDGDDLQRRRERVLQLQQRRHEDAEKRRRQKEAENHRRREEQRAKEMEADRKKAEERQRREQILQQYKERKAEDDPNRPTAGDSSGRLITAPVPIRPRSAASRRSPATLNRHSTGAVLGAHMDLLLPSGHYQPEISGAITHRRSISPSLSASDIATMNGRQSKKVMSSPGTSAAGDAVFGGHVNSQQLLAAGGSLLAASQLRQPRVSSPDPLAGAEADPNGVAALKLYVQPSFKSNRGIIINAISHCVLAGTVNTDMKGKVLEELARSDAKHFLILFRDAHLQYRGIYAYSLDTEEVAKVSGQGPKVITAKMLERFYKYNSGSKSFSEVTSTKHLSVSIDAITIKDALWQKKPGPAVSTPKKGH